MNYWPRWINAIKKRTASLSLAQMGAYDRLLDHYYAEEQPLPASLEECCRIVGAINKAEQDAVRYVLQKFFVQTEAGYANERADEEILLALPKIAAAQANGRKGGRPSGSGKKPTGFPAGIPPETGEEPSAKAPHPQSTSSLRSEDRPRKAQAPDRPADVAEQVWSDWLQLRRTKRAPVTATVLDGARAEADKAGLSLDEFLRVWCRRGSQGLEAAWLKPDELRPAAAPATFHERQLASKRAEFERITGQPAAGSPPPREVIDITPRHEVIPHA